DTALGADLAGDALVCEPVHNLIRRARLSRDGVTFAARRVPEESSREFLSSSDSWFRPVEVRTGTDGALWVVDLHRFVVEHPRWIPPERLQRLEVRAGADGGRIYRVRRRDSAVTPLPRLTGLAPEALAQRLGSPNGPLRDLAQRELLSLPAEAWRRALPEVKHLASALRSPAVRAQALSLLALRDALPEPLLESALRSDHPGLVSVALGWVPSGAAGNRLIGMLGETLDQNPALRFHRSLALSRSDAGAMPLLVRQLSRWPDDAWIRASAIAAARRQPEAFLEALIRTPDLFRNHADLVAALLAAWDRPGSIAVAERCLTLVDQTLPAEDAHRLSWWMAAEALKTSSPSLESMRRRWRETLSPRLAESLGNAAVPEPVRMAAARLRVGHLRSAGGSPSEAVGLLTRPLSAGVRKALLGSLQEWGHPAIVPTMLEGWRSISESDRRERLELLLGRPDWIPGLLTAIERGQVHASELSPAQTAGLRQHGDASIRERASRILPHAAPDVAALLTRFAMVPELPGDAARGRALFQERCASCHAVRGDGPAVGPDLASFSTKPWEAFLRAVIDPNAAVDPRHSAVTVALSDGREWTGVVGESSANRLTLLLPGGQAEVIAKASIRSQTPLARSLMPEGLTEGWSPQSMADLWAWIRHP
ncbi:MAG: c-type cytochrome, partial [Verrucomicrobiota bacterium]